MCQEILFILVGYFQDTELTVHIYLCLRQLAQSDTVLMDMTDDVFTPKIYGTFQKYYTHIFEVCKSVHHHKIQINQPTNQMQQSLQFTT